MSQLDLASAEQKLNDPALLTELLMLLSESFPKDWAQLKAAVESDDWALAGKVAHSLKGVVPLFSHDSLTQCLISFEGMISAKESIEKRIEKFHVLSVYMNQFEAELRSWLFKQIAS
jgi:HPt (histidine-containing phosphotransfer) domain-containing protein